MTTPSGLTPVTSDRLAAAGIAEIVPPRTPRDIAVEAVLALPNLFKLVVRLLRDSRVPARHKVVAGLILAYVVSPLDVIPDLVPGLGFLDDVLLGALALHVLGRSLHRRQLLELWDGSEDALDLVLATFEWGAELVPEPVARLFV